MPEAEPPDIATEALRTELDADLAGTDVARLHDDVGERQDAVVAHVLDPVRTEADYTRAHVDCLVRVKHPLFERGRGGNNLERGSWLVDVLGRPITSDGGVRQRKGVGIERGLVCQGEDLAGGGVHDHDTTPSRVMLPDSGAQLPLGDVLDVLVDGQLEGDPGGWRTLNTAERTVASVGLHEHPCRVAR